MIYGVFLDLAILGSLGTLRASLSRVHASLTGGRYCSCDKAKGEP